MNSISVDDGEIYSCPAEPGRPPKQQTATVIQLLPHGLNTYLTQLATRSFLVGTTAALRGSGVFAPGYGPTPVSVIDIPGPGVTIVVSGPRQSSAIDTLLATLKVTSVDTLGCPERLQTLVPSGNLPSIQLVPGHPIAGVVCQYLFPGPVKVTTHWLAGSASLTAAQLHLLTTVADQLRTVPATAIQPQWLILRYQLRYADGTQRTIAVAPNMSPLVVTDEQHTAIFPSSGADCTGDGCPRNAFPDAYTH